MDPQALLAIATVVGVLATGVLVAVGTERVVDRADEQRSRRGLPKMGSLVELSIHTFVDATVRGDFEMAEMAEMAAESALGITVPER